ncbi:hypothetical protein KKF84_16140 [Myxococcota bacterium]|nr:hypothetical protein [Myxococcota bacterium]MBU1536856.1 hypothetical protein [Myxococcota bacterium]
MKKLFYFSLLAAVLTLITAGCNPEIRQATTRAIPTQTVPNCEKHCMGMGLTLSAVIIVMNSAGCVCEKHPGTSSPKMASAAIAGGAIIQLARIKAHQEDRNQRRQENR